MIGNESGRLAVVENAAQLLDFGRAVQHDEYPARLENGKKANNRGRAVGKVNGHTVAAAHTKASQSMGQPVCHLVNFQIGEALPLGDERHFVRQPGRCVLKKTLNKHTIASIPHSSESSSV